MERCIDSNIISVRLFRAVSPNLFLACDPLKQTLSLLVNHFVTHQIYFGTPCAGHVPYSLKPFSFLANSRSDLFE